MSTICVMGYSERGTVFGRNGQTAPNPTGWDEEVLKQIGSALDKNEWLRANLEHLAECKVTLTFTNYNLNININRPSTVVPPIIPIVKTEKEYPPPPPPLIGGLL